MGAGQAMGDRLAQMEAMDGAARCLEALRFDIIAYTNLFLIIDSKMCSIVFQTATKNL